MSIGRQHTKQSPAQLEDPDSFISILKPLLALRESLGIANSELIDVPQVQDKALVIHIRLPLPKNGIISHRKIFLDIVRS